MSLLSRRTAACTLAALTLAAITGTAAAQSWPEKPIKLIVPFAPGGTTDIVARMLSQELSRDFGQSVVVENRPGAGGNLGADAVAKSAPDGYTLLICTVGTQAINPSIYKKMPYDATKDFAPVTLVASVPNVMAIYPELPARTPAELAAYAKSKPISFASSGAGTSIHLSGELFKTMTGVDMPHVAYKGSSQALTDLMGGQVQVMFDNLPSALPHIQSGKLRALAVTSARRAPQLPNVPTMIESGYKDFELGSWFGVVAPAGTPAAVVSRLNAAIQKIATKPEFEQRLTQQGAQPLLKNPAEFSAYIATEQKKWAAIAKASGASLD